MYKVQICKIPTVALLLLLLTQAALWAQVQAGRMVGTVTDPSRAVIGGAKVTVTDTNTKIARSTQTNASGNYVLTPLQPGVYDLSVSAPGFATVVKTGIELQVAQFAEVDIELPVGEASSKVEVTAQAQLLETESGSLGQVVTNNQIINLPLNGRNFSQLAELSAGVAVLPNTFAYSNQIRPNYVDSLTISGTAGTQTGYLTDGVDVTDYLGGTYIQTSIDAIQEFKLQQNAYSAEFSRAGGGYNLTTKSGTNMVHGGLFEFLRNENLDARNFFAIGQDMLKRSQFGGTIGAPVVIPKVYNGRNRTFIFGSYEATRQAQGIVMNNIVPTPAMLAGNFSAGGPVIYDPSTTSPNPNGGAAIRSPFPNNLIPSSRLSSQAQYFDPYVPAPNLTANTASFSPTRLLSLDQFTIRGDQNITDKHRFFARWSFFDNRMNDPNGFPKLGIAALRTRGQNVAAALTSTLTPSAVQEFRFSYLVGSLLNTPFLVGTNYNQAAGIAGLDGLTPPGFPGSFPDFTFSGYASMQGTAFDQRPKTQNRDFYQALDNVTWIKGNHVVKFGGEFRKSLTLYTDARSAQGLWSFNGSNTQNPASPSGTGSPMADWDLGIPYSCMRGQYKTSFGGWYHAWAAFIQDDIKVSDRLSFNVGLRYEYTPWDSGYKGQLGTFNATASRPLIVASDTATPDLTAQPSTPLLMTIFGNLIQTSSQAGLPYSITYTDKKQFAPRFGFAWRPVGQRTVVRGGYGIFYEGTGPVNRAGGGGTIPFYLEETVIQTTGIVPPRTLANFFLGAPIGSALGGIAITPTKTHLPMGYDQHWDLGIQEALGAKTIVEAYYVGDKGTHVLGANEYFNLPPAGPGAVASRRPYPTFGNSYFFAAGAASVYHSLQAKVERRLASGLWFLSSYTYSKIMVWQPQPVVGGNTAWERALSNSSVPHNFIFSAGYELPVGHGKHFLGSASGISNAVLGGWQVQGIFNIRSGLPFTPTISSDVANIGITGQRPNRLGSGTLANPTVAQWFNRSAFVLPATYTYGNSGANIITGPGLKELDCAIFKEFPIRERLKIQFRSEFFNLSNTPSFMPPTGLIDSASGATITATSTSPRQIQFALRLSF
jgi:hypothetical protein